MSNLNADEMGKILLAEAYLRAGKLGKALDAYAGPISSDKLMACGDVCQAVSNYQDAMAAYIKAGSMARLIALGEVCAKASTGSSEHKIALESFLHTKALKHLIDLGEQYLDPKFPKIRQNDYWETPLQAFTAADVAKKLVELGDFCLKYSSHGALQAYIAAGDVEKLIVIGDIFFAKKDDPRNSNQVGDAYKAYRAANARDKMLDCANWYINQGRGGMEVGRMSRGFEIYAEVGADLPMELLAEILDSNVASEEVRGHPQAVAKYIAMGLNAQQQKQELGILSKPISEIEGLSARAINCLGADELTTIGELVAKSADELLGVRNFGIPTLEEVREALKKLGLKLREDK